MSELNSNESRLAELKKLGELKEAGLLSDEEFEAEKNRLLNAPAQYSEGELYKAGSHEGAVARPLDRRTGRKIFYTILRFYLVVGVAAFIAGFSFELLAILGLAELMLLFISKKREKKIGITPWILKPWKQGKSQ